MEQLTVNALITWEAHREPGSIGFRLRAKNDVGHTLVEFMLTPLEIASLARFVNGVIERDAEVFRDVHVTPLS